MKQYIFLLACAIFFNLESSNPTAIDTSFGNPNGYVEQSLGESFIASQNRVLVQDDGKILSIGTTTNTNPFSIIIVRYLPDGTLDSSYGNNATPGITIQNIDNTVTTAYAAALQSDGKLVVVGSTKNNYLFAARFTTDGYLDTSTSNNNVNFTNNGYVIATISNTIFNNATAIVINETNGNILIGGTSTSNGSGYKKIFIFSYASNGTLNTSSFGSGLGYITTPIPHGYLQTIAGSQMIIQPDGKIVIPGGVTTSPSFNLLNQLIIYRYTNTGVLDTSTANNNVPFTSNGYVIFNTDTSLPYSLGEGIALQPNGSIIISGYAIPAESELDLQQIMTIRYLNNGTIDTSFRYPYGYTITPIHFATASSATSTILESSGKIIAGGSATIDNDFYSIILVRYNSDGTLDTTLNEDGYMLSNIQESSTSFNGLGVQSDGKFLIVAQAYINDIHQMTTIRYLGGNFLEASISAINAYGSNANLFQDFLYVDFYAQIISDADAQTATISAINTILSQYAADYVDQPNFNYVLYLYLLEDQLALAQADLLASYGDVGINQFFIYLNDRIAKLSTPA
jgi:uncharacterized delta-60 repeat protein